MVFVMTVRMTRNEIVHVISDVEIGVVVLVQLLYMMNSCPFCDDLSTKKTDCSVSFDDRLARFLPQFGLIYSLVILHPTTLSGIRSWLHLCPCCE